MSNLILWNLEKAGTIAAAIHQAPPMASSSSGMASFRDARNLAVEFKSSPS